jgi:pilus assembly protein CpaB
VKSRLLAITLAVVLAVVGIVAVLAYVRQANDRAVNGLRAETVLVANQGIPAGTSLSKANQAGWLGTEKVPESSLSSTTPPVQSVTAANQNYVVSGPVEKGQVLLENMLATSTTDTSGGFVIPSGKVAISIDVCVPEAVADYVTAGSDVAVFGTTVATSQSSSVTPSCSSEHPILGTSQLQANFAATGLVLSGIQVLAVGQNPVNQSTSAGGGPTVTEEPVSSSSSSSGDVLVTVAVSPTDAEDLILMCQVGIPYLALQSSPGPLPPTSGQASGDLFQNLGQAQP